MAVIIEFLLACGVVAIVGSIMYSGYRLGRTVQKEADAKGKND
jgi:hypothetical protein